MKKLREKIDKTKASKVIVCMLYNLSKLLLGNPNAVNKTIKINILTITKNKSISLFFFIIPPFISNINFEKSLKHFQYHIEHS